MREGSRHRILAGRWLVVASLACAALVGFLGAPFAARALPPLGMDPRPFGRRDPASTARVQRVGRNVRATMQRRGERGAVVLAVAIHTRGRRVHQLPPVHRPRRQLEHPQPHQRRLQGAGVVPGHRRVQLPLRRGDDELVGACVRRRDRHQLATEPAWGYHVERRGSRRPQLQEVPAQPLEGRVSGPQLLLGDQLQHDPRPHAFPVRDGLLRRQHASEGSTHRGDAHRESRRGVRGRGSEPGLTARGM